MCESHLTHPLNVSAVFTQMETLQWAHSTNTSPKSSQTEHHFSTSVADWGERGGRNICSNSLQGQPRVAYTLDTPPPPCPHRPWMRSPW